MKQLKIGEILDKWQEFRLGNLIDIKHGFAFKGESFSDEPTEDVLLSPGNFNIGGGFKAEKFKYYKGSYPKEYVLNEGDIIITMTDLSKSGDTLGYPAKIPSTNGKRYLHNQRLGLVIFESNQIDKDFLYWLLRTKEYQRFIVNSASGSTVKHTAPSRIKEYTFFAPSSLNEQRAIARIFSDLDAKIKLNDQMNKTLESTAQALFKRWFLDFEFPGHGKTNFGKLPVGWRKAEFGELVSCVRNQVRAGDHLAERNYVPIECMPMKQLWLSEFKDYTEAQSSLITFEKGDILFGAMRAYFHRVNYAPFAGVTRTTVFVLRPKKFHWMPFALCLMNTNEAVEYANAHSKGSTMPYAVWENSLERMPVIFPSEDILIQFSEIIDPFIEKMNTNAVMNQNLIKIRDSLLPKLMTGDLVV